MMHIRIFVLLVGFFAVACEQPATHVFVEEIPGGIWPRDKRISGEFEVTDTINPQHFFITLRNTADYPYSNIYLFVHTYFPNNRKSRDTIECVLTDRAGRWLGSGNGFVMDNKIITNKVLYQYQKKFPLKGAYRIEIEHAMRQDTIFEILDVGIVVEPARP